MGGCSSSTSASCPEPDGKTAAGAECARFGSCLDMSHKYKAEKKFMSISGAVPGQLGYSCRKGRKPEMHVPNQDSWSAHIVPLELGAYGVFDGHGFRGHLVSDFVRASLLPDVLRASCGTSGDPSEKVQACYRATHHEICGHARLRAGQSGTTATVVVHDMARERLVVSHVGDSRAVLLKTGGGKDGEQLVAEDLTRDHKPDLPDERARIVRAGGCVVADSGVPRVAARRGSRGIGLNLSRSLGDALAHQRCGVSATPEVSVRPLAPEDRAVLIASDGVWEVMEPREAAELLSGFGPEKAMEAAERLVHEATARWERGTQGVRVDDITVVLAWLPSRETAWSRASTGETLPPSSNFSSTEPLHFSRSSDSFVTWDSESVDARPSIDTHASAS